MKMIIRYDTEYCLFDLIGLIYNTELSKNKINPEESQDNLEKNLKNISEKIKKELNELIDNMLEILVENSIYVNKKHSKNRL